MAQRRAITSKEAPKALGPYSQAIAAGDFVFLSGQIGLDPATGNLVDGGIEQQTERALRNLTAVLWAAGASLDHVIKTTVFMTDLGQFAAMNTVYAKFFPGEAPPARATVQVAALNVGARIELQMIAAK